MWKARAEHIHPESGWLICSTTANFELWTTPEAFTPSPDALFLKGDLGEEGYKAHVADLNATFARVFGYEKEVQELERLFAQ